MFQYPGLRPGDNVKDDVKALRSWLARFLPELEQQLSNLGTDNFSTAYNERLEGLTTMTGAGKAKTTSEAIAEHLLDRNNPHQVTLSQLGYQPQTVAVQALEDGMLVTLCGLIIQTKHVTLEATTAEAAGSVYAQQITLGDWAVPFEALYAEIPVVSGDGLWAGGITDESNTSAGTLTIYSTAADTSGTVTLIGIGGPGDGEQ